jgi:predicted PurR-regulated permease PerM
MLTRERLLLVTIVAITGLVLSLSALILVPFIPAMTWAMVLAIIGSRLFDWLLKWLVNRNLAAGTAVVLIATGIIGPVVWICIEITREASYGLGQLQHGIKSGAWEAALQRNPHLNWIDDWVRAHIDLANTAAQVAGWAQSAATSILGITAGTVVQAAFALFALFFFFRDQTEVLSGVSSALPFSPRETDMLFDKVRTMVRASIYGNVLTSVIQGALGGIMFRILGIPAALLWAVVMFLLSLVPNLGSFLVWAPAAVWLMFSGSWTKAIVLVVWGIGVVGSIDNFLYPFLVGRDVRIHTLLLFLALAGGVILFGAAGLVLGPVVIALGLGLIDVLRERTRPVSLSAGTKD